MADSDSTNGDFAGLSVEQVKLLLETIATNVNTMTQICDHQAHIQDSNELGNVFRGLSMMLSGVGALADRPLGGECVGGLGDWLIGPNFRQA